MSLPLCPHLGPQYVLVTYSHNVAFGPLLPFPLLLFLGGMVSHPAETTRLSLCYRSVVCSGSGGGGQGTHHASRGQGRPGVNHHYGCSSSSSLASPSYSREETVLRPCH